MKQGALARVTILKVLRRDTRSLDKSRHDIRLWELFPKSPRAYTVCPAPIIRSVTTRREIWSFLRRAAVCGGRMYVLQAGLGCTHFRSLKGGSGTQLGAVTATIRHSGSRVCGPAAIRVHAMIRAPWSRDFSHLRRYYACRAWDWAKKPQL